MISWTLIGRLLSVAINGACTAFSFLLPTPAIKEDGDEEDDVSYDLSNHTFYVQKGGAIMGRGVVSTCRALPHAVGGFLAMKPADVQLLLL